MGFDLNTHVGLYVPDRLTTWGRQIDRTVWSNAQPDENPDPIDSTRYFKAANNWAIKAGLDRRDISRLYISAKGIDPDDQGAYFPAQLLYTHPDQGTPEQLELLATQYDEWFDGGFGPILKSLQMPALEYGRAIGEIDWQNDSTVAGARFISSCDPEEFILYPPDYPPGIYKKRHTYSTASTGDIDLMPPDRFMLVTYDSLFNNPYGQSAIRPLIELRETYHDVYDAWRMGLIKAGYGSWVGEYDETATADDKTTFMTEIQKIANGTASIFDERNKIRNEKLELEAQAFLDFHVSFVQAVSVLLCGSATALIEGKYGSYAKEESTTTRQKSEFEQSDALLMGQAFTYQFNRWFLTKNFIDVPVLPQLQLIPPELIMPTTPEGQKEQGEIKVQTDEEDVPQETSEEEPEELAELQEETPVTPDNYGSPEPEPDIYFDVNEAAREWLEKLPVKNYDDLEPGEGANVFTIKRLHIYPDAIALQERLKGVIVETLDEPTERAAWEIYWAEALKIFQELGHDVRPLDPVEFLISFRQARQNAFQAGIDALMEEKSSQLFAIRIETRDDPEVRFVHSLWHNVVLMPDDPRLEKLKCPMDWGCRCNQVPVWYTDRKRYPLTPESEIPTLFPEGYKYYKV